MRKSLTVFVLVLLGSLVSAQVSKTINVSAAGTLSTLLTPTEKATVTNLTVKGSIDARDFLYMGQLPSLSILDITAVTINEFSGVGGTWNTSDNAYPANGIPVNSFDNTGQALTKVLLPQNISYIGGGSFSRCAKLESITIPASVTSIGAYAFGYCTLLNSVICLGSTPPVLGSFMTHICFARTSDYYDVPNLYVPSGSLNAYKDAPTWSYFLNKIHEAALTVTTQSATSISASGASLNGKLEYISNSAVSSHGFCWNTTGSPTIADNKIDNGAKTAVGAFNNSISGLSGGTKYYVKAFATDGGGTVYGSEVSFTTASMPNDAGIISGLETVCQGQNLVRYTVPTVANATSYIWTLPAGVIGGSSTNSIIVNYSKTFTSGNISVKGHNNWGDGTASTLAVTANLLPEDAGVITGNNSVCQGENSVMYSVPSISNVTSYVWTLPVGATGTSSTNTIAVSYSKTATSGNITVKGHNDCGDGVAYSLPIVVNQLPIISMTNKSVVSGGSVSLNPIISYTGIGTLKYKWTPATGLNNDTIENPTATLNENTTYTIVVTTPNGCSSTNSISLSIIPMSKPEIGIVSTNSSNKNIVVWNKPVTTGIESYYIYRETTVSNEFEKIGVVSYDSLSVYVDNQSNALVKSNKYKISVFDRSGFESPQSNYHKTMHLSINKGQNNTWNLIWEPYEGFNVSTYNIYRGTSANSLNFLDATSGSSTQYSDITASEGDVYYQLEVISPILVSPTKISIAMQKSKESSSTTMASYNSSRSNIATNFVSGIDGLVGDNNRINVYPNPAKDFIKIDFEGGSTFEIMNLMGQVVYNGDLIKNTTVQMSSFSSGVYIQ